MRIELKRIRISKLIPHESTIEERVRELIESIRRTGLQEPIIVDSETYMIIDGHHRVEACKRLGITKIPALLVNYLDDDIELRRWLYVYKMRNEPIDKYYQNSMEIPTRIVQKILYNLRPGNVETIIKTIRSTTKIYHDNVNEMYWLLHEAIENIPELSKVPEDQYDGTLPVVYTPIIFKQIVIYYAKMGKVFPPKTTRHIVPYSVSLIRR
ncbi:MAG: ParB N-terminal domain-containing protein [Crenarchaeota archaeon]|nr:ParB N-terminal domain-containing protein [Thermoproteota archaeon]